MREYKKIVFSVAQHIKEILQILTDNTKTISLGYLQLITVVMETKR